MMLVLIIFAIGAVNPNLSQTIADRLYHNAPSSVSPAEKSNSEDNERKTSDTKDEQQESDSLIVPADYLISEHPSREGILDMPSSYIAPSEQDLEIPDAVKGRNGYDEPTDSTRAANESEAQSIEDELGYGNTGDDLSFDELFYPYYYMLDEDGKSLYRQIYANADSLIGRFKPIIKCTPRKVKNVFEAVIGDHPELFWIDTGYSTVTRPNGEVVEIDLKFNKLANNLEDAKSKFNTSAEEILSGARNLTNDFDKEKYVHDRLADKIDYSLQAPMNQGAYSALVNGSTVCAGYARAMQYLCQQLGIPCYYCTGFAGENHAWNIIKLDDDFYNVDVTWDDSAKGCYDYFNKPDSQFNKDHMRKNLSVYLPACNGSGYQVESTPDDQPDNYTSYPEYENGYIIPYGDNEYILFTY